MGNLRLLTALVLLITITSTLAGTIGTSEEYESRVRRGAPAKKTNANGTAKPSGKGNKAVQKNSGNVKKVEGKQTHVMPFNIRRDFVPCEDINAKRLDRCCANPSSEFFTEGQLLTANHQFRHAALFDSITEYRLNMLHKYRNDNLVDLRNPNIVRRFAEEACLLDAVFKEYQLFDSSGDIDYDDTKNFMLSTSSRMWRPITANIIDDCQKVMTVLQQKNVLNQRAMNRRKTNETCSIVPYIFIECARRNLTLSCPETQRIKNVKYCVFGMDALRRCDAFSDALEVLTVTTKAPATAKIVASANSTTNTYPSTTTMYSTSTMSSTAISSTSNTVEPSTTASSTTVYSTSAAPAG